jgi:carbon-monoxide dehydrogenase medium subunit
MYSPEFDYYRAGSIAEIGQLLRDHPGAKILAGGHSLIPLLKLRLTSPPALVDIGRVQALRGVALVGDRLRIGALTTHAELSTSPLVRAHAPALSSAAGHVGDLAVRNRGTIGGNVAHADPASDLPAVLVALGASFAIVGPGGERSVPVDAFFIGMMTTALGERDVLTAIEVPVKTHGQGMAYVKCEHPASRYAVIGVAAVVTISGGTCTAASIALAGLVATPTRVESVERVLVGQTITPQTAARAAAYVASDLGGDLIGDLYASSEYRRGVAPVYVRRAILAAAERAH